MKPHLAEKNRSATNDGSTKNLPESPTNLIDPERLPESLRRYITPRPKMVAENGPEMPARRLSIGERIAGKTIAREFTEEERTQWAKRQLKANIIVKFNPELRLQLPPSALGSLDLEICREYYWKYKLMRLKNDADKVADLLASFLEQNPLEWRCCGWKNDAVAELLLWNKKAGERWFKEYWKREQKAQREAKTLLSDPRVAAREAAFDIEWLHLMDEPEPWLHPGFLDHAIFVRWLNKNWERLATKKKGNALFAAAAAGFRHDRPKTTLTDDNLLEISLAYSSIASTASHSEGAIPPSAVVLTLAARRHGVSPRLVTIVRAEQNKRRRSQAGLPKARS